MTYSPYGKHTYSVADKIVAAMLANPDVSDEEKAEVVNRVRDEVQATWNEVERERRAGVEVRLQRGELIYSTPIPQIEIHHIDGDVIHFRSVG